MIALNKTENEIQKEILTYLKYRGIIAWRNQSGFIRLGGRFINLGEEGSPDIVGLLPSGRFLAIEVKTQTTKPSKIQKDFLQKITNSGGLAIIARSVEDVEKNISKKN